MNFILRFSKVSSVSRPQLFSAPLFRLAAGLIAMTAVSCAGGDDSKIALTFTTPQAYLLPGKTSSCTQTVQSATSATAPTQDISERYFSLLGPQLAWSDTTRTASIVTIQVTIHSSGIQGGEYNATLSSDELQAIFGTNATVWDGTMAKATSATNPQLRTANALCNFMKFGGVSTVKGRTFGASAVFNVIGYATDPSTSESEPFSYTTTVEIENSIE